MNMRARVKRKCVFPMAGILALILISSIPFASTSKTEMISRRDLLIDFGDGLIKDAQLTFPAAGDGPLPGVLIIPGGGAPDMDEYMPPYSTDTGERAQEKSRTIRYWRPVARAS